MTWSLESAAGQQLCVPTIPYLSERPNTPKSLASRYIYSPATPFTGTTISSPRARRVNWKQRCSSQVLASRADSAAVGDASGPDAAAADAGEDEEDERELVDA